ncbi:molybdopterin synthase sulfur carrier subunit [Volucribacter amazonae]|uniref:Molybdopterin synthase sulfur carrier subunit n=1 Tax=Volucribacter amazonae TaxID=256731 RepID=A0A9X4PEY7_9PAST|nr:molybdopterin synthase sulfur carrier subunit [Volucribacter amazonae]MDG6896356.1 molybdopterin synthase sulfur carrier subunit [Volucribacter amazonae]
MIKILFFGQIRELVNTDELMLEAKFEHIQQLLDYLVQKGDKWQLALQQGKVLVAVNQTLSSLDSPIQAGDEIAFFPPVTGG